MKLAVIFPGQGVQGLAMYERLAALYNDSEDWIARAEKILGFNIRSFQDNADIAQTSVTQPLVFVACYIYFQYFIKKYGLEPSYIAGHSLGQYTAIACSEGLSFDDMLRIVKERGQYMHNIFDGLSGGMVALREESVDREQIAHKCTSQSVNEAEITIAGINSPHEIVLSYTNMNSYQINRMKSTQDGRIIPLQVSAPFHHPIMNKIRLPFRKYLNQFSFSTPKWPIISNVTAKPFTHSNIVYELLRHLESPVRWSESIEYMINQGVNTFIELGPKSVLKRMVKEINPAVNVFSFSEDEDMNKFEQYLSETYEERRRSLVNHLMCELITNSTRFYSEEERQFIVTKYHSLQAALKASSTTDELLLQEAVELIKGAISEERESGFNRSEKIISAFRRYGISTAYLK